MKKSTINEICTALLILLFTYTALSKFMDYHQFVYQMQRAPVSWMPYFAPVLGFVTPLIESLTIAGLLVHRFRHLAFYGSVILLIIFELYITIMLLSGQHLPCSCGGVISRLSWKQHLIFNAFWIIIGLTGIVTNSKVKASDILDQQPLKNISRA